MRINFETGKDLDNLSDEDLARQQLISSIQSDRKVAKALSTIATCSCWLTAVVVISYMFRSQKEVIVVNRQSPVPTVTTQ